MSLRNPFAPSLSSWCRFWASTPSSRRRSPLMCRLQSCETSWPLISMACQQVRPGSWAPVQSAYWRGLDKSYDSLWTWSASFGFYFEYQKCRVQVVFFTICPNNKVDKLKRLPNLWQQIGSLIWKNKHLDQNLNKIQIPNANLQEDEGFLSSQWGYNLLMKCPLGTDGHITWNRSYTKRTEPNWDIRVKLKEPDYHFIFSIKYWSWYVTHLYRGGQPPNPHLNLLNLWIHIIPCSPNGTLWLPPALARLKQL